MLGQNYLNKSIENSVLRSLLPHIIKNQEYYRQLTNLGHISSLFYSIDSKPAIKQKKKCIVCQQPFQNLLMLILHLQIKHQKDQIKVQKYEYTYETLTIYLKFCQISENRKENMSFFAQATKRDSFVQYSLNQRVKIVLDNIINKLEKKVQQIQRIYFHGYDVFRQINQSSQDENSEDQAGIIQEQLQKLRISQFNDVNQNDKIFFMKWNQLIHIAKKKYCILDQNVMLNILTKLVSVCRKFNIPRMNLIIHLWTLWSSGKINRVNAIKIISMFDKGENQSSENNQN